MIDEKIEIGFDVSGNPDSPFVTLNDPVKGILGSTEYVLGGTIFYDVSEHVVNYSISRGKTRQLDRYNSGSASVTFNNETRIFDPLYSGSPYAGQIIPRRPIRITINGIVSFAGWIDDWDLEYSLTGKSSAFAKCSDGLSLLANQTITAQTFSEQITSQRVATVLSDPLVSWPFTERILDEGKTLLQADTVEANTNALAYIQKVSETEFGSFFVDKQGNARFKNRFGLEATDSTVSFTDDGTGIGYSEMLVVYGSELLYNNVVVNQLNGVSVAADDLTSQAQYGIFTLTLDELLMKSSDDAVDLSVYLASKYSTPEYRFDALTVPLHKLSSENQTKILNLELGDAVSVTFTPNGIGSPIVRTAEVIRVSHSVGLDYHNVTFGLGSVEGGFFRLSDPIFGRLSAGNTLAF